MLKQNILCHAIKSAIFATVPLFIAMNTHALNESDVTQLPTITVKAEAENSPAEKKTSASNKLNLSIKETPQSITVMTRQQIDDLGVTTLMDVVQNAPGIFVQETDSERVNIISRGYSVSNFQLDGMLSNYGSVGGKKLDTAIYENIEVVRGATGLTTAIGDPSATINLNRKRPTDELKIQGQVTAGRWDKYRAEVDVGGPIAFDGKLRARAVAAYQEADSFRDYYSTETKVAYGIVEADLTDSTLLALGYEYQEDNPTGVTWGTVLNWGWNPETQKAYLLNLPRSTNLSANWSTWAPTEKNAFIRLEQKIQGDWIAKIAYQDSQRDINTDVFYGFGGSPRPDGTGVTIATMKGQTDESIKNLDLNVGGSFELFGQTHKLNFGWGQTKRDTKDKSAALDRQIALQDDQKQIPDWRNWNGNANPLPYVMPQNYTSRSKTEQSAAYLAGQFKLADPLTLVTGARLTDWETDSFRANSAYSVKNELTPYAGLLFDITQDTTMYASYTDIFKPQNLKDKNGSFIDPVVGANYEIGIKSEFFDKQLLTSFAAFQSKQDNLAEEDDTFIPTANQEIAYKSTGKGNKVQGYEFEASGKINPNWDLNGGFTYTKAENNKGEAINTTQPRRLLRLQTGYQFDGALENLRVGAGLSWQSKIWRNGNMPISEDAEGKLTYQATQMVQNNFFLVNLMANYKINENLSTQVNINNLFDKNYYRNVGFYSGVHYGEPLNATVSLKAKF